MAQQHPENISDANINDDQHSKSLNLIQNGSDSTNSSSSVRNSNSIRSNVLHQPASAMNDKISNIKSPAGQGGQAVGGNGASGPSSNNGNDIQPHPYSSDNSMSHYQHSQNLIGSGTNPGDIISKEESNSYLQTAPVGIGPPSTGGHHPAYQRYHHNDPNIDPYRYGHSPMQPSIGKPPPPGISSSNRPPQRYIPGQSPQGPTPTLNSLLQSHPPPPQHRFSNNYDPQQQQSSSQQPQQHPPPPPHQSYGPQQVWAPPPRPYSPQHGPSQAYRTPPPTNTSRGQSPYPPSHGQGTGSYPSSPQQPGGPPPPSPSNQNSGSTQYSPYPQRYPTPPGVPSSGPNHRTTYSTHQYPDPNRPWPGGSSPAASPGPGGHPHPPASPHQTQHGGPPPNSPGHAPSPSPQPSQASPSPHQELVNQNSNDSSSGGVGGMGSGPPGTPNPQQVMRPTPSPTGSSGSRSMSPAVGQQNITRPSSNQSQAVNQMPPTTSVLLPHSSNASNPQPSQQPPSQGNLSGIASNSQLSSPHLQHSHPSNNMQNQGNYPTQPPMSHLHGYKMGPGSGQGPGPNPQNLTPYPPPSQPQQYPQGNYSPRPPYSTNYPPGPPTNQATSGNNIPPGPNQYQGRPLSNHSGSSHSQFPPYQQNWVPASQQGHMANQGQSKATPPPPSASSVGSPRPLNYLKQHLQHKVSYIGNSIPTPPQGYGNGPSLHLPMGPPHHMGPPTTNMGPPTTTPQVNVGSTMPPQSQDGNLVSDHNSVSQDNGVSSSGPLTANSHQVTSVITTGPEGTLLDDASQQSSLSNASAASGEDPQCTTPKSRKNDLYNQTHLVPPSTSPSGHPHNDDFDINSPPNWSRTPVASPQVFNSHGPSQDTYRATTKKSDSLCKLYDMDENPDRRGWLDKLLGFMDERRTPITACPTISKQPLDLYRLYIYVKERGGFVEVCKVTKSKTWKDIAGLLGIGASSSAAYTLRKHYTKNLLAFECHFDRGGIDPLPIIQQVEAGTKKKSTKPVSVPSPAGSSNSQDSFPPPAPANTSIEGYTGYPGTGYQPGTQSDYNTGSQHQRSPSQSNAQVQHTGTSQPSSGDNISVGNPFDDPVGAPTRAPYQQGSIYPPVSRSQGSPYPGQPGYNQYVPAEQYSSAGTPGQFTQNQGQFVPPNRPMYPPVYGPDSEGPQSASNTYAQYGTRPYSQVTASSTQVQTPMGSAQGSPGPGTSQASSGGASSYATPPAPPPTPQEYYRPTESPQPRRHPDFVKDTQPGYPGYNQRPPIYAGWQGNTVSFRGQYPSSPAPQSWASGPRTSGPVPPPNHQISQWSDQHRYPSQSQPPYQSSQQQQQQQQHSSSQQQQQQQQPQMQQPWSNLPNSSQQGQGSALRPPPQRISGGKPFNMPPPQPGVKTTQLNQPIGGIVCVPQASGGNFASAVVQVQKKDIVFPPESVEATTPILYRRKRLTRSDVCPIDPWRIFMSLRSGLLAESTWALDILNILLFDDTAVQYFGLAHLPGLLNLLLEHFQKNLSEMFDNENDISITSISSHNKKRLYENNYRENVEYLDLGQVTKSSNPEERVVLLSNTPNYTLITRKGVPVRIQNSDDDIFVTEHIKDWDYDSNKSYQLNTPLGTDPWTFDQTELYPHDGIIDVFKSEIVDIPFARYIVKCSQKNKEANVIDPIDKLVDDNNGNNDREIKFHQLSKKRRMSFNKNGFDLKKAKRHDVSTDIQFEIKKEPKRDESSEDKTEVQKPSVLSSPAKRNENLDSDCREVDMDIEPRVLNGTQIIGRLQIQDNNKFSNENELKFQSKNIKQNPNNTTFQFDPISTVRDPATVLHRRRISEYEDECYTRDESSLYLINECQDSLARRCICLSNIFRNLTFVPGNETILAKSSKFLALLGKLLLLNHEHLIRTPKTRNYDREEDTDFSDSCSSLQGEKEWWWEYLIHIRENMLVVVANLAGHLELSHYEEIITRPVLDGLLHWAVCPSAHGQDPFPSCGPNTALSPQRLALEALCKLCVTDANVDLVIATPPFSRLEKLCAVLTRHLCRNEDQVLREFSVNLLHYLAAADSAMSRTVALQSPCISYLVAFIEQAEQTALGVANQHGINYLRENPDSMGTSLDMLRRAAGTLLHLSKHPDNRSLFMQQEQRLLGLVMSHILDQQVALIISRVLFQVSRGPGSITSMEYRLQQRQQNVKTVGLQKKHVTLSGDIINNSIKSINSSIVTSVLLSSSHGTMPVAPSIKSNSTTAAITLSSTSLPSSQSFNFSSTNLKTHNINTRHLNLGSSSNNFNKSDETALNDISNSSSNSSSNSCNSSTGGNAAAIGHTNINTGSLNTNSSISSMENLSGNKNNISTTTTTITGNSNNNSNSSMTTTSTAAVA